MFKFPVLLMTNYLKVVPSYPFFNILYFLSLPHLANVSERRRMLEITEKKGRWSLGGEKGLFEERTFLHVLAL